MSSPVGIDYAELEWSGTAAGYREGYPHKADWVAMDCKRAAVAEDSRGRGADGPAVARFPDERC